MLDEVFTSFWSAEDVKSWHAPGYYSITVYTLEPGEWHFTARDVRKKKSYSGSGSSSSEVQRAALVKLLKIKTQVSDQDLIDAVRSEMAFDCLSKAV